MGVDVYTQGHYSSQQHMLRAVGHMAKGEVDWGIHVSKDSLPTYKPTDVSQPYYGKTPGISPTT